MFVAVVTGLVLAQVVSRLTEYFTSTETRPVREIAEATSTGPATTILSGISSGFESTVYAVIAIAGAFGIAIALGDGNIQFSFYLVALTGMGMLATTGVVVSEDTFGPVSDNAAGIAEMSGEFSGEPERIMVSLDAVGNTTKAVTKGFAIGSAVDRGSCVVRLVHRDDRRRAQPRGGRLRTLPSGGDADQRRGSRRRSSGFSSVDRSHSCSARWRSARSEGPRPSSCRRYVGSSPTGRSCRASVGLSTLR